MASLDLGPWAASRPLFASAPGRPRIAGISGGSTSAMMAALLDEDAVLSFQNTGREAARTYEFLDELADGLGRPIAWLEYRPPARRGGRPSEMRVAEVTSRTCDRSGAPFEMLLDALAAFRATKGKGPIAPWWRSRICTTYLKTRLARKFVEGRGWSSWDEVVGLRADEPARVAKLRVGVPRRIARIAPLDLAGITKTDVAEFWRRQSFALDLDEWMGNCTGCFLKDQSDLSRALALGETDAAWWIRMAAKFPGFGGKNFAGYERLAAEAPARIAIEAALRAGEVPEDDGTLDPSRFKLVVVQERKRAAGQVAPFSCNCEGSEALANMDEDEESDFIAELPSEEDVA